MDEGGSNFLLNKAFFLEIPQPLLAMFYSKIPIFPRKLTDRINMNIVFFCQSLSLFTGFFSRKFQKTAQVAAYFFFLGQQIFNGERQETHVSTEFSIDILITIDRESLLWHF